MSDFLRRREAELVAKLQGRKTVQRSTNMSFTRQQYEKAAQTFLEANPDLALKYMHPQLLATVVEWMKESLPSVTAARIAFNRLVAEGVLVRTDGGDENTDRATAAAKAKATINKVAEELGKRPLTREDAEYFGGLDARTLSRLYYGEDGSAINEFAILYRRAMVEWGFKEPLRYSDTPGTPAWAEAL